MLLNMQELRGRSKNIIGIIGVVVGFAVVGGVVASTFMREGETPERIEGAERVGKVEEPEAIDPPKEIKTSPDAHTPSVTETAYEGEKKSAPVRQLLSREELWKAEWPASWDVVAVDTMGRRSGDYKVRVVHEWPKRIVVEEVEPPHKVAAEFTTERFVPSLPDVRVKERQEAIAGVQPFIDGYRAKLYMFITFGSHHLEWLGKVYESDIFGNDVREMGKETVWHTSGVDDVRLSADRTTLSYIADETHAELNESTGEIEQVGDDINIFHIIDLLDTEKSIQFVLPHGEKLLGYGKKKYWVPAWQFVDDGVVEFTLYYRESVEKQKGVKELWRHDRKTGESTLIESRAVTGTS